MIVVDKELLALLLRSMMGYKIERVFGSPRRKSMKKDREKKSDKVWSYERSETRFVPPLLQALNFDILAGPVKRCRKLIWWTF